MSWWEGEEEGSPRVSLKPTSFVSFLFEFVKRVLLLSMLVGFLCSCLGLRGKANMGLSNVYGQSTSGGKREGRERGRGMDLHDHPRGGCVLRK